jgi:hypothetical protein
MQHFLWHRVPRFLLHPPDRPVDKPGGTEGKPNFLQDNNNYFEYVVWRALEDELVVLYTIRQNSKMNKVLHSLPGKVSNRFKSAN